MLDYYPKRIVCMTEETTETLYLLGEEGRIAGISGFTVRPPRARKEKPKVSAFTSAKLDRIFALEPDLVLGFSDLQADIARELIRQGVSVHIFNHRSIHGILTMIAQLGALVGAHAKTATWLKQLEQTLAEVKHRSQSRAAHPIVYFEEWNDPIITGIQWVSEIIELAGGLDCCREHAQRPLAKDRIVSDPSEIIDKHPDIIVGSWCGKKFRPELVAERPGWDQIPAVRQGYMFEIKSADILQPGPAALTDGLTQMQRIIDHWCSHRPA